MWTDADLHVLCRWFLTYEFKGQQGFPCSNINAEKRKFTSDFGTSECLKMKERFSPNIILHHTMKVLSVPQPCFIFHRSAAFLWHALTCFDVSNQMEVIKENAIGNDFIKHLLLYITAYFSSFNQMIYCYHSPAWSKLLSPDVWTNSISPISSSDTAVMKVYGIQSWNI